MSPYITNVPEVAHNTATIRVDDAAYSVSISEVVDLPVEIVEPVPEIDVAPIIDIVPTIDTAPIIDTVPLVETVPDEVVSDETIMSGEVMIKSIQDWLNKAFQDAGDFFNMEGRTLQICLAIFLIMVVLVTCLYKRRKLLAKNAIQTMDRYRDRLEADR